MTRKSSGSTGAASTTAAMVEQDIKTDIGIKDDARKKLVESLLDLELIIVKGCPAYSNPVIIHHNKTTIHSILFHYS